MSYALNQYNTAIRMFNQKSKTSSASAELGLHFSIVLIQLECLLSCEDRIHIHLEGAFAILESLKHPAPDMESDRGLDKFENALQQIMLQIAGLEHPSPLAD
jgi:hypothetical protein